jgi:hypothetical protein
MANTEQLAATSVNREPCIVEIVPPGGLTATFYATVHAGEPDIPPTTIVDESQDIVVKARWCIQGDLRHHLCGTWCLKVAWESCGDGSEGHQVTHVPFDPCLPDNRCYEAIVRIPAGRLGAGECGTVYCFCVTLTSEYDCPRDGGAQRFAGPIFGFCRNVACIMVRAVAA